MLAANAGGHLWLRSGVGGGSRGRCQTKSGPRLSYNTEYGASDKINYLFSPIIRY